MSFPNEKRLRNILRQTLIVTAATLALSGFRNGGMRLNNLQRAAGQAIVLPKATGKSGKFRFFIGTTITSNTTTFRTNGTGTDTLNGLANVQTSTFQCASNTNTVTFNGTTTGGILGSYIEFEDVGLGTWRVNVDALGSGTAATPFSNT